MTEMAVTPWFRDLMVQFQQSLSCRLMAGRDYFFRVLEIKKLPVLKTSKSTYYLVI